MYMYKILIYALHFKSDHSKKKYTNLIFGWFI